MELHGLDVYDPTSDEIRTSSADDIACWFEGSDSTETASRGPRTTRQQAERAAVPRFVAPALHGM